MPPYDEQSQGYSVFAAFLAFIFPMSAMVILYVAVAVKMRQTTQTKIKRIKRHSNVWVTSVREPSLPMSEKIKSLPVPKTVPQVFITNVDGDISMDFSSINSSNPNGSASVYLGNGSEPNKVFKDQLKREEALQRR